MRDLFRLEFKKIALKRMNMIVLMVCLVIVVGLFALPVKQFIALDKGGNQLTGSAAIAQEKIDQNTYAGRLTNEKIRAAIAAYQALFADPRNVSQDATTRKLTDAAYYNYFFPYYDYWKLINGNYTKPTLFDSSFTAITTMSLEDGFDFYGARKEKIHLLLNQTYADWNFSANEKAYWLGRTEAIETPIAYAYHAGWESLLNAMELFILAIIGICICVSSVFSGEYQSGAASIILASRYGKSKLVTAKILAAFAYSLAALTLFVTVGCGIQLTAFGWDGWDLPIQVLNSISPYSLSLAGATGLALATLYMLTLGMVSLTLLLSARLKSTVPVLVAVIFVMMLPMFLGISETSGVWNRILMLLPYRAAQPVFADEFFGYFAYPLGGWHWDIVTVRMITYALAALLAVPLAVRAWRKHQVM